MLQSIRDNTRGWIGYTIVAVLVVPFALFGVYNYFTGGSNPPVAEVEGEEITSQQLDQAVQQQRQRLQQMLGDQYDPSMFGGGELRRQALNELINTAVLDAFAGEHGLRLTDQALRQQIQGQSFFQVDGAFSPERYRAVLQQNNLTPERYEAQLRREGAAGQLQRGVSGSVFVTDAELARFVALQRQQRDIAWLRVAASYFAGELQPNEAALRAYYQANKSLWERPREVRLAYVELSPQTLAERADISKAEVRDRYESLRDTRYTQGGERRVQHILLEGAPSQGEEGPGPRQRLTQLRRRITSGELSFAEAAKQHSQDPGSADDGGDLGWIARGDLSEPLEEAVYGLQPGQISRPVDSEFGWHLLRVTEVRDQEVTPFEQVRDEIRNELEERAVEEAFVELRNELANVAYENPGSLGPAASAVELPVETTDWVSRAGTDSGITARDAILEAAFSREVLEQGRNSELVEIGENHAAVVRVAEQRPATVLPFEQVREQVRERLVAERAAERAREVGEGLLDRLAGGAEPAELAAEEEAAEWTERGWVTRDGGDIPREIGEVAFRIEPPGEGEINRRGLGLSNGDYAVILLRGVRDGRLADVPEEEREELRTRLRELDARSAEQALVQALRAEADVTIYDDRL